MKKVIYIILVSLLPMLVKAQVGIGTTTPDSSAVLEIKSASKGLLIPAPSTVPQNPKKGLLYFDSDASQYMFYDGEKWQCVNPFETNSSTGVVTTSSPYNTVSSNFSGQVSGNLDASGTNTFSGNGTIPIGGIIMWSGTTIPDGWALCDGYWYNPENSNKNASKTTTCTKKTPDLQGKFIVGYSGSGDYNNPGNLSKLNTVAGNTGGSETVTIQTSNLPPHYHEANGNGATINITSSGGHTHTLPGQQHADNLSFDDNERFMSSDNGTTSNNYTITSSSSNHTHPNGKFSGRVGNGGFANDAIDIRPPYYVLAFIMRIR